MVDPHSRLNKTATSIPFPHSSHSPHVPNLSFSSTFHVKHPREEERDLRLWGVKSLGFEVSRLWASLLLSLLDPLSFELWAMDPSTRLDHALFQLTPTRTRFCSFTIHIHVLSFKPKKQHGLVSFWWFWLLCFCVLCVKDVTWLLLLVVWVRD